MTTIINVVTLEVVVVVIIAITGIETEIEGRIKEGTYYIVFIHFLIEIVFVITYFEILDFHLHTRFH